METNNLLFTSRISSSETDDNKRCYLCLRLYFILFIIIFFYKYPESQILTTVSLFPNFWLMHKLLKMHEIHTKIGGGWLT